MSIFARRPRRIICQINPRMRCSRPSFRSLAPMLTVDKPSDLAEVMTRLLFSVIWKLLRVALDLADGIAEGAFALEALLRTRSSIVSGTESLMSLARRRPSVRDTDCQRISVPAPAAEREERTLALVKDLEGVGRNRQTVANVGVAGEDLPGIRKVSSVRTRCTLTGHTWLM